MPRSTPSARTCGRRCTTRTDGPHFQEPRPEARGQGQRARCADPAKAKAIRESALFYARQRTTDLLTQMAVTVQGYLALDLVKKNNVEAGEGGRSRIDHHRCRASHGGYRGPGHDQPEAGAGADWRAQHHHRRNDRFPPAKCCGPRPAQSMSSRQLDHSARNSAARLPEHLRHDGPDRPVQADRAGQHETDRRHARQGSRKIQGLHRACRRREPGQARRGPLRRSSPSRANDRADRKVERAIARVDRVLRQIDERGGPVRDAASASGSG